MRNSGHTKVPQQHQAAEVRGAGGGTPADRLPRRVAQHLTVQVALIAAVVPVADAAAAAQAEIDTAIAKQLSIRLMDLRMKREPWDHSTFSSETTRIFRISGNTVFSSTSVVTKEIKELGPSSTKMRKPTK